MDAPGNGLLNMFNIILWFSRSKMIGVLTVKYEGVAFSLLDPSSFSFVKMKLFGYCVIRLSDLVDLWVIRIKKPMILCARNTSRSREQSRKRRSRSENMRTVCFSGASWLGRQTSIIWLVFDRLKKELEDYSLAECCVGWGWFNVPCKKIMNRKN